MSTRRDVSTLPLDGSLSLSRRSFVKLAALAAAPVPAFLLDAAAALGGTTSNDARAGKTLVVVQLSGGNDGLNTVLPYEDDRYYRARPSLAVGKGQALKLDDGGLLGLHPRMGALHEQFREGNVTVIENVGYPNSDRSHFRSMEIWHTARPDLEGVQEGWLGRAVASGKLDALDVGDDSAPLALASEKVRVPALQNLDWLDTLFSTRGTELRGILARLTERRREGDLEFLRGASRATFTQLARLEEIRNQKAPISYPGSSIGQRLEWTGQLIAGGYPSRIYYLSFGGFDTHARQKDAHGELLAQFSDAVAAFQRHMSEAGLSNDVVLVAFSEFGRRVKENGSQGTDHGSAGPMFIVSGAAKGGVVGGPPDLENLFRGDVPFEIDFRSVYATLLESVLDIRSDEILAGEFETLPLIESAGRRARV